MSELILQHFDVSHIFLIHQLLLLLSTTTMPVNLLIISYLSSPFLYNSQRYASERTSSKLSPILPPHFRILLSVSSLTFKLFKTVDTSSSMI